MNKHVEYKPEGVCARKIEFDLEDGKLHNVHFTGGCPGNLAAIGKLIEGQDAEKIAGILKGNLCREKTLPAPISWQRLLKKINSQKSERFAGL